MKYNLQRRDTDDLLAEACGKTAAVSLIIRSDEHNEALADRLWAIALELDTIYQERTKEKD